jgi:biopolymer transport protein TolR
MTMDDAAGRRLASEINITPMIDVLLVLLIIFMVVVPVASKGDSTLVPHPASQLTPAPPDPVVLEILKDRAGSVAYRINQQSVSDAELPARLAGIYSRRAPRVLFIKGNDQLSFRQVVEVIDVSHAAGVDRVSLMTSTPRQLRP